MCVQAARQRHVVDIEPAAETIAEKDAKTYNERTTGGQGKRSRKAQRHAEKRRAENGPVAEGDGTRRNRGNSKPSHRVPETESLDRGSRGEGRTDGQECAPRGEMCEGRYVSAGVAASQPQIQQFPCVPPSSGSEGITNFCMLPVATQQTAERFRAVEPCVPPRVEGTDQLSQMYRSYMGRARREMRRRALAHVDIAYKIYEQSAYVSARTKAW